MTLENQSTDTQGSLFPESIQRLDAVLEAGIAHKSFLLLGGGGVLGRAVCRKVLATGASKVHVVDRSMQALSRLVSDRQNIVAPACTALKVFNADLHDNFLPSILEANGPYDYCMDFSSFKSNVCAHDSYALFQTIKSNVTTRLKNLYQSRDAGVGKYFYVCNSGSISEDEICGRLHLAFDMLAQRAGMSMKIASTILPDVSSINATQTADLMIDFSEEGPPIQNKKACKKYLDATDASYLCLLSLVTVSDRALLGPKRLDVFYPNLSIEAPSKVDVRSWPEEPRASATEKALIDDMVTVSTESSKELVSLRSKLDLLICNRYAFCSVPYPNDCRNIVNYRRDYISENKLDQLHGELMRYLDFAPKRFQETLNFITQL